MSVRDAARAKWRADLHEFGADRLRFAGLADMAEASVAAAASLRAYADLMVELAAAKVDGNPVILKDVKVRVANFRRVSRTGGTPRPGVLDNFEEPSDAELIEMGY